jgi:cytochrome c553
MNSRQFQIIIPALFSVFLFNSIAQSADLEGGEKLVATCLHCHGSNGNSKKPLTPSLAGQRSLYIESQIKAYQSGQRTSPVMKNMVAKLNKKEIRSLSIYLAKLSPESAGADKTLAEKGQAKFAMCTGCHGASAEGRSGFPRLAGQQPEYLEKQLLDFKSGFRKGGMMNSITRSMPEQDIKEIAAYLSNL